MKLSQFLDQKKPISESHVETAEVLQEIKGLQKQLTELLLQLTETSQLGHRISGITGVETSYFGDIKEAGQALSEQIENLRGSIESAGTEIADEEEEEVESEEPVEVSDPTETEFKNEIE